MEVANFFWQYVAKTPFYGAQTTIYCCLAENLQSGKYYDNCKEEKLVSKALLVEDQEKLWDLSERLVNQSNKNGLQLQQSTADENNLRLSLGR